jgi:hypothetical protein
MRKTISLSLPHDLGEAEARRRLVAGLYDARATHPAYLKHLQETWDGNRMEFKASVIGQTITGRVEVEARRLHIHIDLPLLLAVFAGHIVPRIESEGAKLLTGPGPDSKTRAMRP